MKKYDYSKNDIVNSLYNLGIRKNDNLFIHSNIGFFGRLKDGNDALTYCQAFKTSIFEVIGTEGTLVVPAFSYSFCNGEIFDKNKTKGVCGMFSEFIRQDPNTLRSDDANFSISAIGKNAKYFTDNTAIHSFGNDSFWERFLNYSGKLCRFNLDANYMTFVHYVEKSLNVSYRYDKPFKGKSIINGHEEERVYYHFVRDLDKPSDVTDLTRFDKLAKDLQLLKTVNLGRGQIMCISTKDVVDLIQTEVKKNNLFLIKGSNIEL